MAKTEKCPCGCIMVWSSKHLLWLCTHCDFEELQKSGYFVEVSGA